MRDKLLFIILLLTTQITFGQHVDGHYHGRAIEFPDIPGYQTLIADLHTHTVFSDGEVWPSIRVQEAIRDGLDVISITDHIEYQPHRADIPHPDRNRSYEIALQTARGSDLIVIRGAEVTRNMPPGHANALFLEDVNKLNIKDSIAAFQEARKQGAFIFWNHPNWEAQKPDGMAELTSLHKQLIKEGLLNGIEVVNDVTYSEEALQIALDHDLTIMGTSDIHGLVDWQFDVPGGGHRPVTLVFVAERSPEGVKEALFNKQTVVFFNDMLVGRKEFVEPLIRECLTVDSVSYGETWAGPDSIATCYLRNDSDFPLILKNTGSYTFHNYGELVTIEPGSICELKVKTLERLGQFSLRFEVLNAVIAPGVNPELIVECETGKP